MAHANQVLTTASAISDKTKPSKTHTVRILLRGRTVGLRRMTVSVRVGGRRMMLSGVAAVRVSWLLHWAESDRVSRANEKKSTENLKGKESKETYRYWGGDG